MQMFFELEYLQHPTQPSLTSISVLSPEILVIILSYLELEDLSRYARSIPPSSNARK
jgi:hypothetical protein